MPTQDDKTNGAISPAEWFQRQWPKPKLDYGQLGQYKRTFVAAVSELPENEALEALIPCMRQSAQDTLDALSRAGYVIARRS